MRILICAQEAPLPPTNGFRLALGALLPLLRERHDVRVLAAIADDQTIPAEATAGVRYLVPEPARTPLQEAKAAFTRRPRHVDRLRATLQAPLESELRAFDPDVVHVTAGALAGLARGLGGRPSVLAALDAWHVNIEAKARAASGARRLLLRAEARRVRAFERTQFRHFDRVVVVTEEDRAQLLGVDPLLDVVVIPNGVDADAYSPDPSVPREDALMLLTGAMGYAPNIAAAEFLARQVLPLVERAVPDVRLALVGRSPAPSVRALAAAERITVTGEVPSLRPWLSRATVYVCPMLSGTGIKNKVLEAMAAGLPCVATPLALQGVSARPGVEVAVGTSAEELASEVVALIQDRGAAGRLGQAAQRYVRANHDWHGVAAAYEATYDDIVRRRELSRA